MMDRNEATWNTMMSGLVKVGFFTQAFELFCEMRSLGVETSGFVISSLITACNRFACMIEEGLQIHGLVVKCGALCDVFVGTSLLHFYGTYGLVFDAQKFFEEMSDRNVVSWTSLMVGHSNNNDSGEVISLYRRMRREGLSCNQNTFATVISSCGLLEDEKLGCQVLGHVLKTGFDSNVSVANSLISMFGNYNCVEDASHVFDHMIERDTISWNSMISAHVHNGLCEEALGCFYSMRQAHNQIDSTTLSSLLSVCSSLDNLKWGRGVHGLVLKFGLNLNVCVCNTILNMYSVAGRSEDAKMVLQEMPERDLISWNSMMACYAQDGKCMAAISLLNELICMRIIINHVTLASVLSACSIPEFLNEGKIVHALAIILGLHKNLIVGNALISMYGKFSLMADSHKVSRTMALKDGVSWNALIGGHAENEQSEEALKAFKLMRDEDIAANYITIVNVLGAFSTPNDLIIFGMPIHAHVILTGFEPDDYVKNSLITMYAKCGDLDSSKYIFHGLIHKKSIAWNAMVAATAHHGCGEDALKLFVEMQRARVVLDHFSFSGALAASASLASLEEGQQLHSLIIKLGFESDLHVINPAMDMYGKCGEINHVLKLLPQPSNRSRLTWNVLISSFARHGFFQKARETFHEMLKLGPRPDHVTFVSLLSACSHGGLVDEGLAYYDSMLTEYGVTPAIEHCVCIIDILGRSGRLAEAEKFIEKMSVPPNDFVWRSLLGACKVHQNLDLGRKALKHLLKIDPSDDSAYVLYSNVCANTGRWEDVENLRRQMGSNKIKKIPAQSWVRLKDKVSTFGIGDTSHPQSKQIYAKMGEIMKMIKNAGYAPDTSFVLHDTDEEQKEQNLWNHSERLALAFGLINTPEGSTVRVFKNLRVCGDCHSVFKFVSGIVGRQIILRDPYRFHHFSDGECSCSDFW